MNAIKLTPMETKATEIKLIYSTKTPREEVKLIRWVNTPNINARNRKANQYSQSKRNLFNRFIRNSKRNIKTALKRNYDDFMCLISGACILASIFAAYMLLCAI